MASDQRPVAIIGTRNPTTYGKEVTSLLSRGWIEAGLTAVSGLALGIDGAAHRTFLENNGRTIAVMAGGLDRVYPKEHTDLFRQVQEYGAMVSEQALGVRPDAKSFPRRNPLISGLSIGLVVVEAAEGSGARHMVYHAPEQERESISSPASDFTNRRIKEGAKLVMGIARYTGRVEPCSCRRKGKNHVLRQSQITSKALANVPEQLLFVTADDDEPE